MHIGWWWLIGWRVVWHGSWQGGSHGGGWRWVARGLAGRAKVACGQCRWCEGLQLGGSFNGGLGCVGYVTRWVWA
ncbi:hypothetical protein TIFTF001_017100 [Ficus carica]|uniref:Uncharacterized protein n=1 Tax=Ficus carica TaxID=3494 RepID=A0AA88AQ20_FICCA|nr:hypothetical protein TIFTF001_017100 [Ficus carica]